MANANLETIFNALLDNITPEAKTIWTNLEDADKTVIRETTYMLLDFNFSTKTDRYNVTSEWLSQYIIKHLFDAWHDATGKYRELRDELTVQN